MKRFFIVCSFLAHHASFASDFEAIGTTSKANAHSFLFQNDIWSCMNHPANMAFGEKSGIAFQSGRKFGIKHFQSYAIGTIIKLNHAQYLGLGVYKFGDELFHFTRISCSFAKQISQFSLGGSVELLQWHTPSFKSVYRPTMHIGGETVIIKNKLHAAAQFFNLINTEFNTEIADAAPTLLCVGLKYTHHKQLQLSTEIQLQTFQIPTHKLSLNYAPIEKLNTYIGISGIEPNFHAGIHFRSKKWGIGYAITSHPHLNFSQTIGLFFYPKDYLQ
jgi:hypothetical protein